MAENSECQLERFTFEVSAAEAGARLDRFVTAQLGRSRARVQKMIDSDAVTLNGKRARASEPLATGDSISVYDSELVPKDPRVEATKMDLDIIFEDEHLLVLNKPPGLVVHPGAGTSEPTLLHGLTYHLKHQGGLKFCEGFQRPGIVHRLDKDTSGIMVCAKTQGVHEHLAKQFLTRETLSREYVALLDGAMSHPTLVRESYLRRDPRHRLRFESLELSAVNQEGVEIPKGCRYAKSQFFRERVYNGRITLAQVRLFTGRTHQIRVHASDLRLNILGDPLYHHKVELPFTFGLTQRLAIKGLKRQMLHAKKLRFLHPVTGVSIELSAPVSPDFGEILRILECT